MRFNDRVTGINGVAAGGVATVEMPVGRRYHGLTLYYKTNAAQATIEADISYIRLLVNGVLIRDINVAELYKDNIANGRAFVLGEIPIFFSEPWRASVFQEEATAWDVMDERTFTVQVAIAGGAAAPTLSAIAQFDYVRNDGKEGRPGLNIVHWNRQTVNVAAAANDIKTLPKGVIQRLTAHGPTSAPTAAFITVANRTVMDLSRTEITNLLAKYGIAQQALTLAAWFDMSQQIIDALPVQSSEDYNVRLTSADAQALSILSQIRKPGFLGV